MQLPEIKVRMHEKCSQHKTLSVSARIISPARALAAVYCNSSILARAALEGGMVVSFPRNPEDFDANNRRANNADSVELNLLSIVQSANCKNAPGDDRVVAYTQSQCRILPILTIVSGLSIASQGADQSIRSISAAPPDDAGAGGNNSPGKPGDIVVLYVEGKPYRFPLTANGSDFVISFPNNVPEGQRTVTVDQQEIGKRYKLLFPDCNDYFIDDKGQVWQRKSVQGEVVNGTATTTVTLEAPTTISVPRTMVPPTIVVRGPLDVTAPVRIDHAQEGRVIATGGLYVSIELGTYQPDGTFRRISLDETKVLNEKEFKKFVESHRRITTGNQDLDNRYQDFVGNDGLWRVKTRAEGVVVLVRPGSILVRKDLLTTEKQSAANNNAGNDSGREVQDPAVRGNIPATPAQLAREISAILNSPDVITCRNLAERLAKENAECEEKLRAFLKERCPGLPSKSIDEILESTDAEPKEVQAELQRRGLKLNDQQFNEFCELKKNRDNKRGEYQEAWDKRVEAESQALERANKRVAEYCDRAGIPRVTLEFKVGSQDCRAGYDSARTVIQVDPGNIGGAKIGYARTAKPCAQTHVRHTRYSWCGYRR